MQETFFRVIGIQELIQIVLILFIGWLLVNISKNIFNKISSLISGRKKYYVLSIIPLIRLAVIFFTIIIILLILIEPSTVNIIAFLGASGIAIGLAFKDYFSSIFAGIVSIYEFQFKTGDWIEINGIYGEIVSTGLRTIEIKTPDDAIVRVPQLLLWDHPLSNSNSGAREILCVTNFYLEPDHNAAQVKSILYDVALTSPYLQLKKPINIIIREKPYFTHYQLKAYTIDAIDQFRFITDLTIRGKNILLEEKIKFSKIPKFGDN